MWYSITTVNQIDKKSERGKNMEDNYTTYTAEYLGMSVSVGEHYFVPLSPCQRFFGIVAITGSGDEVYTECVVEPYEFDGVKYKLYLVPIDKESFCKESYYTCDFFSLVRDGYIIKKENDNMHVEFVEWNEPIENTCAYVRHYGSVVTE